MALARPVGDICGRQHNDLNTKRARPHSIAAALTRTGPAHVSSLSFSFLFCLLPCQSGRVPRANAPRPGMTAMVARPRTASLASFLPDMQCLLI